MGVEVDESFDWKSIMRPPRKVPENLPISKLLRHFQASHQLLAFVIDGTGQSKCRCAPQVTGCRPERSSLQTISTAASPCATE